MTTTLYLVRHGETVDNAAHIMQGHMGRQPQIISKTFTSHYHETKTIDVELFTWEKLDAVDKIKDCFKL